MQKQYYCFLYIFVAVSLVVIVVVVCVVNRSLLNLAVSLPHVTDRPSGSRLSRLRELRRQRAVAATPVPLLLPLSLLLLPQRNAKLSSVFQHLIPSKY